MKKLIIIFLLIPAIIYAQSEKSYIRDGNKLYKDGKYNDAEINYRKSLEENPDYYKAKFNLGDALYKQENFEEAARQFLTVDPKDLDKETKAKVYHNLGNSLLQSKKLKESIEAYKLALKNNPGDMDTKYNLEYARKMLKQQQEQQQNQNQNKDQQDQNQQEQQQQQNQNQEQQNKQQQQQNQQNQEQQNKQQQQQQSQQEQQQQKQNQQQQQQQAKKDTISKEDAERILRALKNEEQKVLEKLKKQKMKRKKLEKNW